VMFTGRINTGIKVLRRRLVAALLAASAFTLGIHTPVDAQGASALVRADTTTEDVLVYGMGYSAQRYSPLEKINRSNVHQLVPKWSVSLNDSRGIEGQPVIKDGVIYVTTHDATVGIDALTGKQLWRATHE